MTFYMPTHTHAVLGVNPLPIQHEINPTEIKLLNNKDQQNAARNPLYNLFHIQTSEYVVLKELL